MVVQLYQQLDQPDWVLVKKKNGHILSPISRRWALLGVENLRKLPWEIGSCLIMLVKQCHKPP